MFRGAYYISGMSINYNTTLEKYNVKSHKKYRYGGGKVNI